jgi:hypothetical protein
VLTQKPTNRNGQYEVSSDWVELAFGYDMDSVKHVAEAELVRAGFSSGDLSGKELRLDI